MRTIDCEEILQGVWEALEQERVLTAAGLQQLPAVIGLNGHAVTEALPELRERGYLTDAPDGALALTDAGRALATKVVRKHRLTERLFHDILLYRGALAERDACEIEHVISDDAIEHICTLLGHPGTCPDGKPIPPGSCCRAGERNVSALIFPLVEAQIGRETRVVYIGTDRKHRLDKVAAFGLIPGETVRVVQRQPSLVLQLGQTQLALDRELATQIFVRYL